MNNFKMGDVVECVKPDNLPSHLSLEVGRRYVVGGALLGLVKVDVGISPIDNLPLSCWYSERCFKPVAETYETFQDLTDEEIEEALEPLNQPVVTVDVFPFCDGAVDFANITIQRWI